MKRKLIQLAGKTLVVSLPKKWVDKYNLKKGEEIDIEEEGSSLKIGTDKSISHESREFDISGMPKKMIKLLLDGVYKAGYDEIKILFDNTRTKDLKGGGEVDVFSVIRERVNELIGVEIISQGNNFCVIKEVTQPSEKEFDTILRRIFLLILDMGSESFDSIKNLKEKNITFRHDTIDKFVSYCLRLLNKYGYKDYKETAILYHYIAELEEISDVYTFSTLEVLKNKKKIGRESLKVFEDINKLVRMTYEIFYSFNQEKIIEAYTLRRKLFDRINTLKLNSTKYDVLLLSRLSVLIVITLNLIELKLAMETGKR